jgi:drug/metabolite transporter (DMT)-like permease
MLFASVFLDEAVSGIKLIGIGCIFLGLVFIGFSVRKDVVGGPLEY